MKLATFSVENFRRLNKISVNLEDETTVFVGANNSGKTSATHLFKLMLGGSKDKFSVHDFSASCWGEFRAAGEVELVKSDGGKIMNLPRLPKILLDIWFKVDESNIHNVIDLLPNLDWQDNPVGVRVSLEAKSPLELLNDYNQAKYQSSENLAKSQSAELAATSEEELAKDTETETKAQQPESDYKPWPLDLFDFLSRDLLRHYGVRHYVLDYAECDTDGFIPDNIETKLLGDSKKSGDKIISELIRVDYLNAQRHLSDDNQSSRGQNLSNRFSQFYQRNLDKKEDDFETIKMLAKAQDGLDEHFADVFSETLENLESLGYPGIENPKIIIKSILSADSILSKDTHIQYDLSSEENSTPLSLPDKYNGLGFKNLIFMFVELLDFQADWVASEGIRPLLHLVFIEEPEAHLHAQLQKVFIDKIRAAIGTGQLGFFEQHVITTHSSHILYNSDFKPIRYFRRKGKSHQQATDVLDLSQFKNDGAANDISFLQRYMKLTHCDLFFADAALLVEGNVERLLLPLFIEEAAPNLLSRYVSVLELGGAHMHRFLPLIKFLGLPTLMITDIDSVDPASNRSGCSTWYDGAETGNSLLGSHFPKVKEVVKLAALTPTGKEIELCSATKAKMCVAFQYPTPVTINKETSNTVFGRTIEEQFAYENFNWLQQPAQSGLNLVSNKATLSEICEELFKRVNKDFAKANFALELMALDKDGWKTPSYISCGLLWLAGQLSDLVVEEN